MISKKFACVFVHIPKTAGQSVELFFLWKHMLSMEDKTSLSLGYNPDPGKGPSRTGHLTMEEYLFYNHLSQEEYERFFSFTFVRNPWARLLSEYAWRSYETVMPFEEFVLFTAALLERPRDHYCDFTRHLIPQHEFIYDKEGKCLVDFVGRYENLQEDFKLVAEKLRFRRAPLPHINSATYPGKKEHYSTYYNETTRDLVAYAYKKDIELFNYSFEYAPQPLSS